jgi:anti-sigma factor RsiW
MNCYETIDLMGDALEGRLAPERRAGFDEHLETCAACRVYLEQLRVTVQALGRLPRPEATTRRRSDLIDAFRRKWKRNRARR